MAKVFITYPIPTIAQTTLQQAGHEVVVRDSDELISFDELRVACTLYDALIVLLTDQINPKLLAEAGPQLKIIANYAVGYDNIDVAAATQKGITITNTPDVLNDAVAEHTIALLLALAHRVVEADTFTRAGKYHGWRPQLLLGTQLQGKTLGIVGVGRIGALVAAKAHYGLGMNILYQDLKPNPELEQTLQARFVPVLEELLPQADAISLHVPLLPTTTHLMNTARLSHMKKTALLVNTSRGPVIDEAALVKALVQNTIQGAALDVFEHEPDLCPGLTDCHNAIITPHIASATHEARDAMAKLCADNIIAVLSDKPPLTPVRAK